MQMEAILHAVRKAHAVAMLAQLQVASAAKLVPCLSGTQPHRQLSAVVAKSGLTDSAEKTSRAGAQWCLPRRPIPTTGALRGIASTATVASHSFAPEAAAFAKCTNLWDLESRGIRMPFLSKRRKLQQIFRRWKKLTTDRAL